MSNYSALKTDINNNIYENNTQQITGTILNTVLKDMVATLGAGYQFAGCAYLDLNPGAPDAKVFYLAGEGLYPNFDNIQVPAGKLGILKWDTRWRLETIEGLGGGGANLTGYVSLPSVSDLPEVGQPTLGYLIGENLYLYVGEGGDTADGKYQNCGSFRGPEGVSITDIEQVVESVENGGRNTIRITLSDGHSYDVYVRNGKASQGLFPDAATLNAQRPNPSVGEYAFVGSGFPADIYVCNTAGTWTDSGADYDGDNVDLTDYATKAELSQLEQEVVNVAKSTVTTENSDLDVVDSDNNILARFASGHIKTKYFDSATVNVSSVSTLEESDLDIVDDDNNIIARFANGHIKTKYFDSSDIDVENDYADYKNPLKTYPIDVTKPQHIGQINVQRKVDALCDIPWTPIRPMPSAKIGFISNGTEDTNVVSGRRYFYPNVEITGIPYSSFGISGKSIGSDITIETFMTALKNPNSVLYEIDLRDTLSSALVASYYGLNCSSFTNYIEGIYATCKGRNNRYAANRILRNPKNAEALQIGDVIYLQKETIDSGHAVIVYKIEKDENGFITLIHEAEEDSQKANKYSYTKTQFENRFFKGGYGYQYGDIYRNVDLVDNLLYEAFDTESYVYSEAVGLNLGNNTNYNKKDNMPIEVTLFQGVTGFDLILNGNVVGTYGVGDGVAGYDGTTIVTIDKSNLANGRYEVRPSSGVSQYFCLASSGTVSVLKDNKGNVSVSVSGHSSNVSPYGVLLVSSRESETTRGLYLMEGENNVIVPGDWIDFINTTNDIAKLVVILRNDYGNIYSELVNIN